jgi:hypothetical protein
VRRLVQVTVMPDLVPSGDDRLDDVRVTIGSDAATRLFSAVPVPAMVNSFLG